jgi:uroporphyrinogen decarboxylase
MTPRERVLRALAHEETDRVPTDFGGTISSTISVVAYDNLKEALGIHTPTRVLETTFQLAEIEEQVFVAIGADTRPLYGNPPSEKNFINEKGEYVDEWNIVHTPSDTGLYYENLSPPLAEAGIEDLHRYPWPDPADPARTHGLKDKAKALSESGYAICGAPNHFARIIEQAQQLRGMEQLLIDLYENPDFVKALFTKILEIQKVRWDKYLAEVGQVVDVVRVGDDVATQSAPIMSPAMYRELLKPSHREYFGFIKERTDAKLFYHSCGATAELIDDFLEIGVDIINPVQVSATGMAPKALKERFGDRAVFWGGIDSQHTLPNGTPEDVRREVRERIDVLGRGGGYVLCPVHNIQPDVSAKNILALYGEAQEARRIG